MAPEELTDMKFVGPATKAVLKRAGVEPEDIAQRRVTHAQLVQHGVNPGVAARIRREHSLAWSHEGGEDLDRRAQQVRGLQDGERAWVAASSEGWSDGDESKGRTNPAEGLSSAEDGELAWQQREWPNPESEDDDHDDIAAEAAWREASQPVPVTEVDGIGDTYASRLAEAGIRSVRSLATCDPERVATSLDLSEEQVRSWRTAARALE